MSEMGVSQNVNQTVNMTSFISCKFIKHLTNEQMVSYVNKLHSLNISDPKDVFTPLRDCDNLACLHYVDSYSYLIQFPSRYTRASIRAYTIYIYLVEGTFIFVW